MTQVAKIVIIDADDKYLIMKRSDHPAFPYDADLPGGTVEAGEDPLQAVIREVFEEVGINLVPSEIMHKYTGAEYSTHQTIYSLYVANIKKRPQITISWEHISYEWVSLGEFLKQSKDAVDTYMHMVYDVIEKNNLAS